MGILSRFARICRADIHGVMDQFEDKGLVLRQHLREMEDELGRKDARAKHMAAVRENRKQELARAIGEMDKLELDLNAALANDRDDIARFLIKKLKAFEGQKQELEGFVETLDRDLAGLRECLGTQRRQCERLRLRAAAFLHRAEQQAWRDGMSDNSASMACSDASDEEIELELLRRKERARKEGLS